MELPPVILRELKWRAGRSKTWWIRLGVVLAAIFAWLIPMVLGMPGLDRGKGSLLAISVFPMLIAAFCGVLTTADSLSREKREGTLGILLLTPLHPLGIVLQKWIAATAPVFSGLVALFPLFALPVLIGGVTGLEALSAMVLTLVTAFVSAALGLMVSAFSRSVLASTLATFCLCALFFGTWLVPGIATSPLVSLQWLRLLNPAELYVRIFSQPWATGSLGELLLRLINAGALTVIFILLTGWILPGVLTRRPALERLRSTRPMERAIAGAVLLILSITAGPVLWRITTTAISQAGLLLALAIFGSVLAKLWVLVSVARVLNSRPWMELILTTPMHPGEYIRQELRRLAPRVAGLLGICLVVDGLILFQLPPPFFELGLAILLFVILDSIALALVGLWNGLKYRSVNEAISFSLSSVMLIPVAISAVCLAFGFRTATVLGGVFLWAALCLIVDILAACSARWMLQHRLRQTASM